MNFKQEYSFLLKEFTNIRNEICYISKNTVSSTFTERKSNCLSRRYLLYFKERNTKKTRVESKFVFVKFMIEMWKLDERESYKQTNQNGLEE